MIQSMNKQFLSRRCNIFGSIRSIHSRTFQQYNCSETCSRFRVIFRTNLRSLSNESVHRLQVRSTFNRKIETIDNVRYPAINQSDSIKSCLNYYCCGPTVYAESHLGHAITYIRSDQIVRTLREFGKQNVCLAMNITDIDDKILQKSKENRRDYRDLAEENFESFMSDMISLRILLPDFIGKVTDHIDMIGDYIRRIYSKGYAYISEETGDVNFDYDAFLADYNIQNEMNFGSGQISSKSFGKRSPKDFVLWKRSKTIDEPRWILKLENVSLEGRPGWHIECSAMINSIFGPKLDVHFGGFDLIFPHHHCEACCSHAFHFDPTDRGDLYSTSKIWLHSGHLIMRSEKMSKSLGNVISIKDFLKKYSPNILRLLCLRIHYRSEIDFDERQLIEMMSFESKLQELFRHLDWALHKVSVGQTDLSILFGNRSDFESKHHPTSIATLTTMIDRLEDSIWYGILDDFNFNKGLESMIEIAENLPKFLATHSIESRQFYSESDRSPTLLFELIRLKKLILSWSEATGIHFDSIKTNQNLQNLNSTTLPSFDLVEDYIQFRSDVRKSTLNVMRAISSSENYLTDTKVQNHLKQILLECDEVRTKLKKIGINLQDQSQSSSKG